MPDCRPIVPTIVVNKLKSPAINFHGARRRNGLPRQKTRMMKKVNAVRVGINEAVRIHDVVEPPMEEFAKPVHHFTIAPHLHNKLQSAQSIQATVFRPHSATIQFVFELGKKRLRHVSSARLKNYPRLRAQKPSKPFFFEGGIYLNARRDCKNENEFI